MNYTLLIGGHKVATADHHDIRNPSTGDVVGRMPLATVAELDQAVDAAAKAFADWSGRSEEARAQACRDVARASGA